MTLDGLFVQLLPAYALFLGWAVMWWIDEQITND